MSSPDVLSGVGHNSRTNKIQFRRLLFVGALGFSTLLASCGHASKKAEQDTVLLDCPEGSADTSISFSLTYFSMRKVYTIGNDITDPATGATGQASIIFEGRGTISDQIITKTGAVFTSSPVNSLTLNGPENVTIDADYTKAAEGTLHMRYSCTK